MEIILARARLILYKKSKFNFYESHIINHKHCLSFAAIRLQGTSAISSGFMVKYGPKTELSDRTKEVRG